MDIAAFRTEFPEFSDTTAYPTSQITFWASVAEQMVLQTVWTTMWATGVKLYVAHEITLARQNAAAGSTGGTPGQAGGPPQSKTVGSVSVNYDSVVTSEKDAGYWNLTIYGKQYIHLARIFGAGVLQLW